jgi:hypothetical protein
MDTCGFNLDATDGKLCTMCSKRTPETVIWADGAAMSAFLQRTENYGEETSMVQASGHGAGSPWLSGVPVDGDFAALMRKCANPCGTGDWRQFE